jgi:acetoin utilization deacetylase AcuC-like enzyme
LRLALARARASLLNLGLPLPAPAKLVYHPEYVTGRREAGARQAFDVKRAERIIDQLLRAGVLGRSQVLEPWPASVEELALVHTSDYLREISEPGRLSELLFLPRDILRSDELMRSFLRQTGGTLLAALRATTEHTTVFNLGGGFHHAQRDRAEGFCAFNDIAIAVRRMQRLGRAQRVLVVDLDFHHGNGTALIFSGDESVFTLSVHGQSWSRVDQKQNNLDLELPPGVDDDRYLGTVRYALQDVLTRFSPDLCIYVAGADAHDEDALGDWEVTDEGLLERDLLVWRTFRERHTPLCVVLGGGYSPFAWTIPYNFIFSVLTGERIDPAYRPGNIEARYRRIKERLDPTDLKRARAPEDEDTLLTVCNSDDDHSCLYMGYYTLEGLQHALERYGFLGLLRERGFPHLLLSMNITDPDRQMFRIHFDRRDPGHLLVELVCRYRALVTPADAVAEGLDETYRMLAIEWMLMQDPRAGFSLERGRLPGQNHPGLGVGRWMLELLRMMSERLDCQGLMTVPEHYHNGYLYSKQMLYFDPEDQGYLEAMKRDLGRMPLVEVSLAIDEGKLRDGSTGEVLSWKGKPQVMPVRPKLNTYFARPSYIAAVTAARSRYQFRLEH